MKFEKKKNRFHNKHQKRKYTSDQELPKIRFQSKYQTNNIRKEGVVRPVETFIL